MLKTKIVTIDAEGRDKGKCFLVTEKSAWDQEMWAMRLLLALGKAGIDIPDDALTAGVAGVLAAGLSSVSKLHPDDAKPLMDEMMTCVSFVPNQNQRDPANPEVPYTRPLDRGGTTSDIEELATILKLRMEVAELHVGFSIPAALSELAQGWLSSRQQNTQTSRKAAPRSSRQGKPRSATSRPATA